MRNKRNRMNRDHVMLIREMEEAYGPDAIARVVASMGICCNDDVECEPCKCVDCKNAILNYIKKLEGTSVRLRELHWGATHNSEHKLTDDILDCVHRCEDEIAEDFMGVIGIRIKVGEILPIIPSVSNLTELLTGLLNDTLSLIASIEGYAEYTGISNVLEEFAHLIDKFIYLKDMA